MRRLSVVVLSAFVTACGLTLTGTGDPPPSLTEERPAPSLPEAGQTPDAAPPERPVPDGGIVFAPSHVTTSGYVLDAPDVTDLDEIDTTALTVGRNAATGPIPNLRVDGDLAVLSAGAFSVDKPLRVRGSRPLVIVAAKDVSIRAAIEAGAVLGAPGPGGAAPSMGEGKGADGTPGAPPGGSGAGHATPGGPGGRSATVDGSPGGGAYGVPHTLLLGGSGGGTGGGGCAGAASQGGAGGGAIQISAIGRIVLSATGGIKAGGGGGTGGCANGKLGGGGGGGSGGTVFLEAVGGIELEATSFVWAGGGAGGQGGLYASGSAGTNGADGATATAAAGGTGGSAGSNGGAGGVASTGPAAGSAGAVGKGAGGGGGSAGRLFLRTRSTEAKLLGATNAPSTVTMDF